MPFEQPFVDPEIFEHPALVEFLERALGQDYVWSHFDSNTPLPDTDYQHWHCDAPPHRCTRTHDAGLCSWRQIPPRRHQ